MLDAHWDLEPRNAEVVGNPGRHFEVHGKILGNLAARRSLRWEIHAGDAHNGCEVRVAQAGGHGQTIVPDAHNVRHAVAVEISDLHWRVREIETLGLRDRDSA
jgi:UV DNA damage repair endonuclease